MDPADGSRCAHHPLGLLRVPGQGRRQVGRACGRRIPSHAAAAVLSLWWPAPAWGQEDRLAHSHSLQHEEQKRSEHIKVLCDLFLLLSSYLPA